MSTSLLCSSCQSSRDDSSNQLNGNYAQCGEVERDSAERSSEETSLVLMTEQNQESSTYPYILALSRLGRDVFYQVALLTTISLVCGNPLVPAEIVFTLCMSLFFGVTQSVMTNCMERATKNRAPSLVFEVLNHSAFIFLTSYRLTNPRLIITQKFISFFGAKGAVKGVFVALKYKKIEIENENIKCLVKVSAGVAGAAIAGHGFGYAAGYLGLDDTNVGSDGGDYESLNQRAEPKDTSSQQDDGSGSGFTAVENTPSSTSTPYNEQFSSAQSPITLESQSTTVSPTSSVNVLASSGSTSGSASSSSSMTSNVKPQPTPASEVSTTSKPVVPTKLPRQTVSCQKINETTAGELEVIVVDVGEQDVATFLRDKAFQAENGGCQLPITSTAEGWCSNNYNGEAPEEAQYQVFDFDCHEEVTCLEDGSPGVRVKEECLQQPDKARCIDVDIDPEQFCKPRKIVPSTTVPDSVELTSLEYLQSISVDQQISFTEQVQFTTFADTLSSMGATITHTPEPSVLTTTMTATGWSFWVMVAGIPTAVVVITATGVTLIVCTVVGCSKDKKQTDGEIEQREEDIYENSNPLWEGHPQRSHKISIASQMPGKYNRKPSTTSFTISNPAVVDEDDYEVIKPPAASKQINPIQVSQRQLVIQGKKKGMQRWRSIPSATSLPNPGALDEHYSHVDETFFSTQEQDEEQLPATSTVYSNIGAETEQEQIEVTVQNGTSQDLTCVAYKNRPLEYEEALPSSQQGKTSSITMRDKKSQSSSRPLPITDTSYEDEKKAMAKRYHETRKGYFRQSNSSRELSSEATASSVADRLLPLPEASAGTEIEHLQENSSEQALGENPLYGSQAKSPGENPLYATGSLNTDLSDNAADVQFQNGGDEQSTEVVNDAHAMTHNITYGTSVETNISMLEQLQNTELGPDSISTSNSSTDVESESESHDEEQASTEATDGHIYQKLQRGTGQNVQKQTLTDEQIQQMINDGTYEVAYKLRH
ncbi:hypothetical protein [Parashewanella tropica]|uniref:hypothetical protein n=1 Tax=Parashewanella tropica TaxID=2547970 RepID=UPI001059E527|nr:hypothetical protein [Parashewanella tropica]